MADGDKTADRGGDHAGEQAKTDVNRVAELVKPLPPQPGREPGHAGLESRSFAELIGISHPSPGPIGPEPVQTAENEKTWLEKEMERRGQAGNSGSSGDQSWVERARILPVEQANEKEEERER